VPFEMLVFSAAGLAALPEDPSRQPRSTGHPRWQRLIYLTIPMLRPLFLVGRMCAGGGGSACSEHRLHPHGRRPRPLGDRDDELRHLQSRLF